MHGFGDITGIIRQMNESKSLQSQDRRLKCYNPGENGCAKNDMGKNGRITISSGDGETSRVQYSQPTYLLDHTEPRRSNTRLVAWVQVFAIGSHFDPCGDPRLSQRNPCRVFPGNFGVSCTRSHLGLKKPIGKRWADAISQTMVYHWQPCSTNGHGGRTRCTPMTKPQWSSEKASI